MKRTVFKIVISLFLVLLTIQANAQQDFTVILKMPPPGTLNVSDFWNITVTNNSGSEQSGYLVGTAKEDNDGMIAKGTTVPVLFKKGINNIKIKDLPKTPDVEYIASDPRYKESLIRKGAFPFGKYEICVKVISAGSNEELGSDCISQEVVESGMLSLISPSDGQEIDPKAPVNFTWAPGGKAPEGGYTLSICEVMNNQTPEIAIKSNPAFFEKKGIKSTTFTYPKSAKVFEQDKKYSWKVINGNTESEVFSINFNRYDEQKITLISPKSNEPIKDIKNIRFEWKGEQPKEGYSFSIFEIDEKQHKEIMTNKNTQITIEKPLFEKTGIRENHFNFRDPSINFQAGHHYGWGVRDGGAQISWPWILPNSMFYYFIDGNNLGKHEFLSRNIPLVVWGDNVNDGIMNPADSEDNIVLSWNNNFLLRWQFPSSFDGEGFVDGDLFVVKIVAIPGQIWGLSYEDPVGSGHWTTPNNPPTCSQLMLSGNVISLSPYSVGYIANQTAPYELWLNNLTCSPMLIAGQRYFCQVSLAGCVSPCFEFTYQ